MMKRFAGSGLLLLALCFAPAALAAGQDGPSTPIAAPAQQLTDIDVALDTFLSSEGDKLILLPNRLDKSKLDFSMDSLHEIDSWLQAIYTLNNLGGTPLIAANSVEIQLLPGNGGDFDHDGKITSADKDLLTQITALGNNDILYDLNADLVVDFDDLEILVHDIAGTWFGDANCDGYFESGDLIQVFQAGKYETAAAAVWSQGDFNGDGVFDSTDLVVAMQDGGYDQGLRPAIAAVPEPASTTLAMQRSARNRHARTFFMITRLYGNFGNFWKSGARFSRNAFRPSCASSIR